MDEAQSANMSVFSSLSIFNKADAQKARYEIIAEGNVDVMIDCSGRKKASFEPCYCRLTRDGRLTVDADKNSITYIVEECAVHDDETLFKLTVLAESDLKANTIELLCRAESELEAAKWLVGIECALRARLQQFQNEMDCARGRLGIVELMNGQADLTGVKFYQCFYYQNSFRVKGLDGPQTSTYDVISVTTDEIKFPMSLIIDTRGRKFVCQAEDPDQYKRWLINIQKDLAHSEADEKNDVDIIEGDLLVGPTEDKLIRVKAKYYRSQRLLETTDFAGVVDSFAISRCTVVAPSLKAPYHFTLSSKMPDIPANPEMTLFVQCPDNDSKKMWVKTFSISSKTLQMLMKAAIKEIELRRIFHKEGSSKDKRRNVEFEEVHELAAMSPAEADAALNNKDEWTVSKLERLNQVVLKMLPDPIMPFDLQQPVVNLGAEIAKSSNPDRYMAKVEKVMDTMPITSRELLELIATHVWRLTTYYRKTHSTKAALPNTDETVWRRLTKYLFRINEQGYKPKEEEERAKSIAHVLVLFQKKTVMSLTKQGEKTQSKTKRRQISQTCKQQ